MKPPRRSPRWSTTGKRSGFLYNIVPTTVVDGICVTRSNNLVECDALINQSASGAHNGPNDLQDTVPRTALALYFVSEDGSEWHTAVVHAPYFYVALHGDYPVEQIIHFLQGKFASRNIGPSLMEHCNKVDLSQPNHIERFDPVDGRPMHDIRHLIKISFNTIDQLERAKALIASLKRGVDTPLRHRHGHSSSQGSSAADTQYVADDYMLMKFQDDSVSDLHLTGVTGDVIMDEDESQHANECLSHLGDIFEHDVKYVNRVCIDLSIRCGTWYDVERLPNEVRLQPLIKASMPPLNVFAWDIECYKAPLKFPDVETDEVILISVMFNGQGYLIVNRCVVARDITEFSYHPCDEMSGAGPFKVFNEQSERHLLQRFFGLILSLAPHIIVTYNGDNFDFPYVQRRAEINDLSMERMLNVYRTNTDIFTGNAMVNMDCYKWVERDSYLPFGSRTLKQVCKIKLKYNPVEIDPEEMVPAARNDPQRLAVYSVSDAVATYYLYMKYIHSFVFALCYIVPLPPNDVLRQGTGTLCENLLMAEAYSNGVLFPNKHQQAAIRYFQDPATSSHHLIYENSYIGARVETLRCGLFRDDLEELFELNSSAYQRLIDDMDATLKSWADANFPSSDSTEADTGDEMETSSSSDTVAEIGSRDGEVPGMSDGMDVDVMDSHVPSSMDTIEGYSPNYPTAEKGARKYTKSPPKWLRKRFSRFSNFDGVYADIHDRLCRLRDQPTIRTFPRIYHLDVGAMYPNIILSQRLQPTAIVTEDFCQKCSYYNEASICQKRMQWKQKLEISPVDRSHILPLMKDLESRTYRSTAVQYDRTTADDDDSDASSSDSGSPTVQQAKSTLKTWKQLSDRERGAELQKVVKAYSQRVFHKMKVHREVDVESIVCQRENSFYVQTVLKFRDKRYVYKKLKKDAETDLKTLLRNPKGNAVKIKEARDAVLLNDSLQLAHKCILNSFYGYVKRGGSRWYSMEMGAIVTYAGAEIIDSSRCLIEDIGIPIELDTDGIWCMLPDLFPAVLDLTLKSDPNDEGGSYSKTVELEYMTTVLNRMVEHKWTNDQYLEMEDVGKYRRTRRNDILFELDGPWHSMFLPASEKSEDLLKKRYVVFNHQKQIVELKGFEIKRRGEMRMIQLLQEEIFPQYLLGSTKYEAYQSAAHIGLRYRKALDSRATDMPDDDMFDLLVARKTVKSPVVKQTHQKCFGITTAKRLAELFKNDSYLHDGNLCLSFLLAAHPAGAARTARAIPIQTFKVDVALRSQCLARWLKLQLCTAMNSGARDILDWDYYREKLDTQLLKLICIPAVLQGLDNPIPLIQLPGWLKKRKAGDTSRQKDIKSFFSISVKPVDTIGDAKMASMATTKQSDQGLVGLSGTGTNGGTKLLKGKYEPSSSLPSKSWIQTLKSKWASLVQGFQCHQRTIHRNIKNSVYTNLKRVMMDKGSAQDMGSSSSATGGYNYQLDFDDMYLLFTERWHLYSCQIDRDDPGVMNCLVSVHNKPVFLNVRVELWRKIYVNCMGEWQVKSNENISVRSVNERYILPRGAVQKNLIELEMRELYYLSTIKNSLNSIFHKTILGVYEARVPISFDFAVKLGNVVNVWQSEVSDALNISLQFKSHALQGTTAMHASDTKYMKDVEIIFVHVICGVNPDTKRRNRLLASVYRKGESTVNKVFIGGGTTSSPGLEAEFPNIVKSTLDKHRTSYERHESIRHDNYSNPERFPDCFGSMYDPQFDFDNSPAMGCRSALRKLDAYLQSLRPQVSQSKYIFYVYSTVDCSEFGDWAKGIFNPVFFDTNVSTDHHQLPSNGFFKKAFDSSLELLYKHRAFVELKLALSQIVSLPLGNLLGMSTVETNKYVLDVMYARALRSSSALLWGTDEMGCDLGLPQTVRLQHSDYDIVSYESNFKVSCPGLYRGYGAKISFNQSLMYNAIMMASKSGDTPDVPCSDLKKTFAEETKEELQHEVRMAHMAEFHPLAFRALGGMFDNLIKLTNTVFEQVEYGTFQGIVNICSFIKPWLSDPCSIMYDAALFSRALLCTQKYMSALLQHISHFNQLKAVHVEETYIVVDANTMSVTKGRHKVQEAFESLASADSRFKKIPFYVEEEYIAMVQLAANCYIRYKNYVDATHTNCHENLKPLEYFPGAVEMFIRYFLKSITLNPLWKTLQEFYEYDVDEGACVVAGREPVELLNKDAGELRKTLEKTIVHDWLQPGLFFTRLYDLLSDTDAFLATFDSNNTFGRLEFPMLPGSLLHGSTNWRLETVKLVAHIMRIDRSVDWKDLSKITAFEEKRHQLFLLAGESEYTSLNWQPPIKKLELSSVYCNECFMVFNLDISNCTCVEDDNGVVSYFWKCDVCGSKLRNRDIESKLIEYMENLFYAYQSQDFVCPECKTVRHMFRRRVCKCGKDYVPRLQPERWAECCEVISQVSQLADMKCLQDCVETFQEIS